MPWTSGVNYREAHLATDGPAILALHVAEMMELYPGKVDVPAVVVAYSQLCPASSLIWVAELAGRLVGFARGEIHDNLPHVRLNTMPRTGYLDELYVKPEYRSRRVATKLFNCLLAALWEQGVSSVWGIPAAPHLRQFYARCGAKDMGAMEVLRADYVPL